MPIAFFRIANGIWFNNNIQVYIRIEGWNVDFPVFYKGESELDMLVKEDVKLWLIIMVSFLLFLFY